MNILLSIIDLYFGQNPETPGGFKLWPFINTVAGSIIGSSAGFGTAYYMFSCNQKSIKENHEQDRKELREDKFIFFRSMVMDIPRIVDSQISLLKDHIEQLPTIKKSDYQTVNKQVFTTIKRISESNDNEQYLHSFISTVKGPSKEEKIQLFIGLYSIIDVLYLTLKNLHDASEILRERVSTQLEEMARATNAFIDWLFVVINDTEFQEQYPKEFAFAIGVFTNYLEKSDDVLNAEDVKEFLLKPFFAEVKNTSNECLIIRDSAIKAKQLRTIVNSLDTRFAEEINEYNQMIESLTDANETLKAICKAL
jgi:hypothetical protein